MELTGGAPLPRVQSHNQDLPRCTVRWAGRESDVRLMAIAVEAKKEEGVVVVMGRERERDVKNKRA